MMAKCSFLLFFACMCSDLIRICEGDEKKLSRELVEERGGVNQVIDGLFASLQVLFTAEIVH